MEIAVVGMSVGATCGVRDHAGLLAADLTSRGCSCTFHWLRREQRSPPSEPLEEAGHHEDGHHI